MIRDHISQRVSHNCDLGYIEQASSYSAAGAAVKDMASNVQIISSMEMAFKIRWPDWLHNFAKLLAAPFKLWTVRTRLLYTMPCPTCSRALYIYVYSSAIHAHAGIGRRVLGAAVLHVLPQVLLRHHSLRDAAPDGYPDRGGAQHVRNHLLCARTDLRYAHVLSYYTRTYTHLLRHVCPLAGSA